MDKIKAHKDGYTLEPNDGQKITSEKIKAMLPRGSRANVGEKIVELINRMGSDTDLPQNLLEEEFMGNLHHMGKIKGIGTEEIINATKFCNLTRNYDNKKAWSIVFPEKYDKLMAENRQIDSHVSMYKNSKLVQAIDEEMLIPIHLQYAPYFHLGMRELKKIGVDGDGGIDAKGKQMTVTPMVRVQALSKMVDMSKQPERAKIDITVNQGEEAMKAQQIMNEQLSRLADGQMARLSKGESIVDVQKVELCIDVIDAEIEQ